MAVKRRVLWGSAFCLLAWPVFGQPLSAIDWLSESLVSEEVSSTTTERPPAGSLPSAVTTRPLGPPKPETEGLVDAADLGIPERLWAGSTAEDVAARLALVPDNLPPNARDLFRRVLISRQASPRQGDDDNRLLIARVDVLLKLGALDEARLLLGARAPEGPELFRRWFDISLLTGSEVEACRDLAEQPDLSPTYPARIYCLARNGDWHVAALTLGTAGSLGILTDAEDALLSVFLDPELFDEIPPAPRRPSPLVFRLYEAAGERLPTATLPLAFAHADLDPILGWKTRLEASERLARVGVLGPGELFAVYGEERSAASGGIWERVSAIADLNADLDNPAAIDAAYRAMAAAHLGAVFADGYRGVETIDPPKRTRASLLALAALQGRNRVPSSWVNAEDPKDVFLAAVAAGDPTSAPAPDPLAAAISEASLRIVYRGRLADLAREDRAGEALLIALGWISEAAEGDPDRLAEALFFLRDLGMEDTARRIALDLLVEAGRP